MTTFRKANVFNKIDETGAVVGAHVYLTDPATNDTISAELSGDHRETSEPALVELVLEAFYKRHYAERAAAEAIQQLQAELAELKQAQETSIKRQEEVNARVFSELEAVKRGQKGKKPAVTHEVTIEEG